MHLDLDRYDKNLKQKLDPNKIVRIGDALVAKDPVRFLQRYIAPIVLALPPSSALSVLSYPAQTLFLTDQFSGEILGNGFDGIYYNSVGCYCSEILSALEEIGAKTSAELLRSTFAPFKDSTPPIDRLARTTAAQSFGDEFEKQLYLASGEFYAQVATHPEESKPESLWELSLNYIEKHRGVEVLART